MTDTDLLRRILGAMHVGPPGPADIAWLAEKGLHALDAIEDQAAATERARIAGLVQAMDGMGYCTSHVEGPCGFRAAVLAAIEGEPK